MVVSGVNCCCLVTDIHPIIVPHVLRKGGEVMEMKRVGEGGRRIEKALGDVGCAFSISETLRAVPFSISGHLNKHSNQQLNLEFSILQSK